MKITLNKKEITGIISAVPHIFDFDHFPTLSGFSLKETREALEYIYTLVFSESFTFEKEFEVDLTPKDLSIIFQVVAQTKSLVRWRENIFLSGEVINFEELADRFRKYKNYEDI